LKDHLNLTINIIKYNIYRIYLVLFFFDFGIKNALPTKSGKIITRKKLIFNTLRRKKKEKFKKM